MFRALRRAGKARGRHGVDIAHLLRFGGTRCASSWRREPVVARAG